MRKYLYAAILVPAIAMVTVAQIAEAITPAKEEQVVTAQTKYDKKLAKWNKLSKEEKLKLLNDKQSAKIKKMQDTWTKLNDDQKIARYESGMKRGYSMSAKNAEYRAKCDKLLGKDANTE